VSVVVLLVRQKLGGGERSVDDERHLVAPRAIDLFAGFDLGEEFGEADLTRPILTVRGIR
jgi:hypothetical protein